MTRELRHKTLPRRGLRRDEAAVYVGVGTSKFDKWVSTGVMPEPIKRDGVVIWDIDDLDRCFEGMKGSPVAQNPFDGIVA